MEWWNKLLIYETGFANDKLAEFIVENGWNDEISCWDKAEDKSIDELAKYIPAYGPPKGFVMWGIQKLHQFRIHIHVDSTEAYEEFTEYKYLRKANGELKRNTHNHLVPIDEKNHTIDATRYAMTYYYLDHAED